MLKRSKLAKKVSPPSFMNKHFDCTVCGGRFKVTKRTEVDVPLGATMIGVHCPYCKGWTILDADLHYNFKSKLNAFVQSQVEPIKAIDDPDIRRPLAQLLDNFNSLLQDD